MQEQFYRSAMLLGAEGITTLSHKKIALFGLGGVGSYVAESLVRSGVGHFLLVDNDVVDITNINRQLPATLETVGMLKTQVVSQRMNSINPEVVVETKNIFVLPDNLETVLDGEYDYLIDAIDTVSAKLALAEYGHQHNIPVISCMGTGNKLDPTKFEVVDIYKTNTCPLCRVMRKELRARGIPSLKVVYSTEPARTPQIDQLPEEQREELLSGRKKATPASVAFVPGVAGMILAGEVICDLLKIER